MSDRKFNPKENDRIPKIIQEMAIKAKDDFKKMANSFKQPEYKIEYHRPVEYEILDELKDLNSKTKNKTKIVRSSYPLPKGAKWHKLIIKFFDGHTVKVNYDNLPTKTFDYKDMGFVDNKNNNPDTKWELLKSMAENGGSLTSGNFDSRFNRNIKYELNEGLKKFFNMSENPIPKYNKTDGYKPLFILKAYR